MPQEIDILSPTALAQVQKVVEDFNALRPSLTPNDRRRRPIGAGGVSIRSILAQITAVTGGDQPVYDARAIELPNITVEKQTPFFRNTDTSVAITPSEVGDECWLFKDAEGTWRLDVVHEFISTDDCQAVAGSRSNMAYQLITTTPTNPLPITADWVDVDASGGAVTMSLPESEVGKRITFAKIDSSSNQVTLSATINGESSLDIIFQYDAPTVAYNGTEWRIV